MPEIVWLNFASFRRRREVFTFKRWKKFGKQAEEHPLEAHALQAHQEKRRQAQANAEADKSFKAGV